MSGDKRQPERALGSNSDLCSCPSVMFFFVFLKPIGHCSDFHTRQPPRGLQFTLGTPRSPDMFDTIVMANLVRLCGMF